MSAQNINSVTLTGNLTRDPELRHTNGGTPVCSLRVAVNERTKNGSTGEWEDRPNFFDVTVWGGQGEACAQHLAKGRPVAIQGRLQWREWQADNGQKRQAVDVVADRVQFLGGKPDANGGGATLEDAREAAEVAAAAAGTDDDIPFARPRIPDHSTRRRDMFVGDRWTA